MRCRFVKVNRHSKASPSRHIYKRGHIRTHIMAITMNHEAALGQLFLHFARPTKYGLLTGESPVRVSATALGSTIGIVFKRNDTTGLLNKGTG
jgi:hypothetical protein